MTGYEEYILLTVKDANMATELVKFLLNSFNYKIWVEKKEAILVKVICNESNFGILKVKAIAFAHGWSACKENK